MINFHVDSYITDKSSYFSAAVQNHNLTKYLSFQSDEAEVRKSVRKLHVGT